MRGFATRASVHNGALAAVVYWQAMFDERKAIWIKEKAAQSWGFLDRRMIGREAAERLFDGSGFDHHVANGGAFWREGHKLDTAKRVARLTLPGGPSTVILDDDEISALSVTAWQEASDA